MIKHCNSSLKMFLKINKQLILKLKKKYYLKEKKFLNSLVKILKMSLFQYFFFIYN